MIANASIIIAAIDADPTATPEEKARIKAALNQAVERPRMITRKQVAALLGVHIQTVNGYTRRGLLHSVKLSKRAVRYSEAEVFNFLQNGGKYE